MRDVRAILSLRYYFIEADGYTHDETDQNCWLDVHDHDSPRLPFVGIYNRQFWLSLGGHDRRLRRCLHEADVALRAQAAGAPIAFAREAYGAEMRAGWDPPGYHRAWWMTDQATLRKFWPWRSHGLERSESLMSFDEEGLRDHSQWKEWGK